MESDHVQRERHGLSCISKRPSLSGVPLLNGEKAAELAAVFETLANDTRLRVLNVLVKGIEASPMELAERVDMKPQAISNQLKRLSDRGIIQRRREGNQVYYRIVDPCVIDLLERGLWIVQDTKLRRDDRSLQRTARRELVQNHAPDVGQFRDASAEALASVEAPRRTEIQIKKQDNKL